MSFREFRYKADAEDELATLYREGAMSDLREAIEIMKRDWEPAEDDSEPGFIVPFRDRFLVFTVAEGDKSILILAGIERVPRI